MWHPGLVARRMAGDRALVLAACATALFATTVLAALVGYGGSVTRQGLQRTLGDATFATAGTTITGHVPGGGLTEARGRIEGEIRRIYPDAPPAVALSARSDSYALPGRERGGRPDLTVFETHTAIERHARLTGGRWPGAGGEPADEVEAVLPAPAAAALDVRVGDVLTLRGRVDETAVARVAVVGLFEVRDPRHHVWSGDRLITTGAERLDYTTYGPFVVRPEAFAERFAGGTGTEARWTVMPDLRGVGADDLGALGDRVARGSDALAGQGAGYTVVTELPELTGRLQGALQAARSTMLIPVLQLVLLAGCAWLLVARLVADHRRGEVALLRTRGLGMRQLAGLALAEGVLIAAPAALLGPLLAGPLLRLAGTAPAVRAAGLTPGTGPLAPLYAVSVATAAACAIVLAVPTLRGANRTFVEARAGIGRTERGRLRRSGGDLALLLVAALAIWQLTRYGAGGAGAGVDPFIVAGPALGLLAGAVLLLRLLPAATRAAERFAAGRRGLAPVLAARQVGRRPLRYAGPVLLLVMAMAVGVLSVTTMSTWRRSQLDQADFRGGADLRIAAATGGGGPTVLGAGGRFAALPGVTGTAAVLRTGGSLGTGDATLLAADTGALAPLLRVRPGLRDGLRLGDLAAGRLPAPAVAVPGTPGRLEFELRLTREGPPHGDTPEPPAAAPYTVAATIADARGLLHRVDLPTVRADGRARTVAVRVADLAGPDGRPAFPLAVRAFHYSYEDGPPTGPMRLEVLGVRGDGRPAALPDGARWRITDDLAAPGVRPVPNERAGGEIADLPIPAAAPPDASTRSRSVHAVLTAPGAPAPAASGADAPLPAVPGVVTRAAADRAKAGAGDTVTLATPEGDQPVTVVGIVPALPATDPGLPGVLVDLPALQSARLAAGADTADAAPGEWWAAVRGGDTGPAAAALAKRPAWGTVAADRSRLRAGLADAPLGAALQGTLVLGFGAAVAFAALAFAVNAAVTAGERAREFAVLRALGVHPRQIAGTLAVEQAFLIALGLAGGTVLGFAVARLVVPHIVLGVQAADPYPPAELVVRWPLVLAMLAGVVAVLGLVLPPVLRALGRGGPGTGPGTGEE
ncbi:ABC transporter permease [Actinomadura rifamycini]|uniref:ABC transporter permease n=1 Tax=Actinomadura rifamycini TaxID=31962 RepID=UPI0004275D19|nr:ABC transporter permease [Actinomadura rifamycini]